MKIHYQIGDVDTYGTATRARAASRAAERQAIVGDVGALRSSGPGAGVQRPLANDLDYQ
ncbi:MAG: hypothetical protein QOD10_5268 [Mycobacterium sp.]|jgi:hypothetical protein|nr:hypothetical protein [Mycobacterium sp.]